MALEPIADATHAALTISFAMQGSSRGHYVGRICHKSFAEAQNRKPAYGLVAMDP